MSDFGVDRDSGTRRKIGGFAVGPGTSRSVWAAVLLGARFVSGGRRGSVRRVRSAVIGIGLSLLPLVLVLQVADGMIRGIAERYIETGTYHIQAQPRFGAEDVGVRRIAESVAAIDGVRYAFPERQGLGLAYTDAGRAGATVRAVSDELWSSDERFRELVELDAGEFSLGVNSAVVGRDMARRLDLQPGDALRVLTVRSGGDGRFLPRVSTFEVAGVISTGYHDLDRLWLFVPYERGVRILPEESSRTFVGVKVDDPYGLPNPLFSGDPDSARALDRIRAELPGEWSVSTWFEMERTLYLSFLATRNLLIFVMFLIVCVASVNIASTLSTMSIEKREELAILKSTGSSSRLIRLAFLSAGFLIGVVGAVLGLAFGLALAVNVNEVLELAEHAVDSAMRARDLLLVPLGARPVGAVDIISTEFYLERIPIRVDVPGLLTATVLVVIVATLASVLPARRAARTRPLEVLRKH